MKIFFMLIFFFCVISNFKNSPAQIKLKEGFEDTQFPPAGWTQINVQSAAGNWISSRRTPELGTGCVVSNFSQTISNNFLVTKSFIPSAGDSLVFSFRQTFWNVYKDTFNVYISNTDSLASGMTTLLAHFHDGYNYPSPVGYGNYAIDLSAFAGQKIWIGFQHIDINGDNIRLDNVRVGVPLLNEVGVVQNISPATGLSACPLASIVPAAVIKNFGELNQTSPFSITYRISGPVTYESIRYDTLCSGNSKTIYFDSLSMGETGIYGVKIFVSVAGDQNHNNDTLTGSFSVYESNFGGGLNMNGGYYFSNSSDCANDAPSQPAFCWKDTSGSTGLILNGAEISGGLLNGDIDNGYFSLGNILPAGLKITFFNNEYDSLFISTNGIIGFTRNDILFSNQPRHFSDSANSSIPLASPLWLDLDFGNTSAVENRLSYKLAANQLIITYDKAPLKSGDSSDYVSFQVCLELGSSMADNSRVLFQYNKESSGADFLSDYMNNIFPQHSVGLLSGSGNHFLSYRFRDTSGLVDFGQILDNSTALEFGPDPVLLNNKCSQLTMKVLFESMVTNRDTVRIFLRDFHPPYKVLEERKTYLDTSGIANCTFTIPDDNSSYFFVVKSRNSITTWTRDAGEILDLYDLNYDFSLGPGMAYGNNMKVRNNISYVYKGDLNDDGTIDAFDLSYIDNDVSNFHSGYLITDLNGDGIIDAIDLAITDTNISHFVSVVAP